MSAERICQRTGQLAGMADADSPAIPEHEIAYMLVEIAAWSTWVTHAHIRELIRGWVAGLVHELKEKPNGELMLIAVATFALMAEGEAKKEPGFELVAHDMKALSDLITTGSR